MLLSWIQIAEGRGREMASFNRGPFPNMNSGCKSPPPPYCGWFRIRSRHFECMVETIAFIGISAFQGFLGGAGFSPSTVVMLIKGAQQKIYRLNVNPRVKNPGDLESWTRSCGSAEGVSSFVSSFLPAWPVHRFSACWRGVFSVGPWC